MSQKGARFNFSCLVSRLPCVYNRAVQCNATLSVMDDVVESPDPASTSSVSPLECTYSITVYAGYGVEIQVKCLISFIYCHQVFFALRLQIFSLAMDA